MLDKPDFPPLREISPTEGMSVAEVIAALRRFDPDARVVLGGPYGGFVDLRQLGAAPVRLNVNACEGFGPHDLPGPGEHPETYAVVIEGFPTDLD